MYEELFYVCFTTDSGELELIASHQTFDEAFEEVKTLSSQPHPLNRYSVKCLGSLVRSVNYYMSEIEELQQRIANKQLKRQAFRDAREILREIRESLPSVAYKSITEKLIELTDAIDKGERYVETRRRYIEYNEVYIKQLNSEIELLKAAFESDKAANKRAIEIMEKQRLIYEMKQFSDRSPNSEGSPDLLQMVVL